MVVIRNVRFDAALSALAAVGLLVVLGGPAMADGVGDPAEGERRLHSEVCMECHGEDGNSISDAVPKLAGQNAGYIAKQINDFRAGKRENPTMTVMAAGLNVDGLADIAAFFAAHPRLGDFAAGSAPKGRELFLAGDAARGIAPCAGCHGDDAKGTVLDKMIVPNIAAQHRTYLREQLRNWRSGERANSAEGIMNKIAKPLTDAEIDDLATYLSGL